MNGVTGSIVDLIGGTPLLNLSRVSAECGLRGRLLVKLEYLNPGHSKKDRTAKALIDEARRDGTLQPGQPVVELTSGNTGTGLAIVCRAYGHRFIAVMSRGNSVERARMMAALGAEVVLVDQAPGGRSGEVSGDDLALVEQRAIDLAAGYGAFRADQFRLPGGIAAHEHGTGPEIWAQSAGTVDVFVDFIGSSGTFTGVTRYLRSVRPDVRAYAVEPAGAAVLSGESVVTPGHRIQGGGYSRTDLTYFDRSLVTDFVVVTDDEAQHAARLLARTEGVFAGYSTGANLAAAMRLLETVEAGATVALLACDSGLKYLSTDLYD